MQYYMQMRSLLLHKLMYYARILATPPAPYAACILNQWPLSPLASTLVLLSLMSKQPHVHEGGRFGGRQSGRKCGDVDESMSDYGMYISKHID